MGGIMVPVLPPLVLNYLLTLLLGAVASFTVLFILHGSSTTKHSLLWTMAVIITMSYAFSVNGYLVDFRHLIILFAGYVGGLPSLILPFSSVVVIRLILGGGGSTLELFVIFVFALVGVTLRILRSRLKGKDYLYVGVFILLVTGFAAIQTATIDAVFVPWCWLTSLGAYTLIRLFNAFEKSSLHKTVLDVVDRCGPAMVCLNHSGNVIFASQQFASIGVDIHDLRSRLCAGSSLLQECIEKSAPISRELTLVVNGEARIFLLLLKKISLLQNDEGVGVLLRDITSLKAAADPLQEFFNLSPDGFCVLDSNAFLQISNGRLEEFLGYSSQELALFPLMRLVHPEDIEQVQVAGMQVLNDGGQLVSCEVRYQHKDGTYRWLSWSSTAVPEQSAIYAIMRDVTEQRLQQHQFLATTERVAEHATLLDLIPDAVIVRTMNNHIVHFSVGAENMYGYKATEVIGCEANLLLKTRFRQIHSAIFLELMERGSWKGVIHRVEPMEHRSWQRAGGP